MAKDYCLDCEYRESCELVDNINFCDDCADCIGCDIKTSCDAGHDIECNNGFEPKSY